MMLEVLFLVSEISCSPEAMRGTAVQNVSPFARLSYLTTMEIYPRAVVAQSHISKERNYSSRFWTLHLGRIIGIVVVDLEFVVTESPLEIGLFVFVLYFL